MVVDLIKNLKIAKVNNLLVVDDEPNVVAVLQEMLADDQFNLSTAYSVAEARSIIHRQNINIVLTDLVLGDGSGIEIIEEARKFHPESQVILMTGRPTIQNVIAVLKKGAYDYLVKPFGLETLKMTLTRAAEKIRLERENIHLKEMMSFYQISEAMGSTIELDVLLKLILDTAVKEFEADVACLYFTNSTNDRLELKASVGMPDGEFGLQINEYCYQISLQSARTSQPLVAGDPDGDFNWEEQTVKSSICQPLQTKGKTTGTVIVARIKNRHPFSQGQLTGLALLSSKASAAIENSNLYEDLKQTYLATVEALANAVEARDSYTRGHIERVYLLSKTIAEELNWNEEQLGDLKMGALLHDIGKIGVPDSILNKPGPLTPEEAVIMKRHPAAGARMVEAIPFLKPAIPYILYHHERHDGKGYPHGLAGDNIPLPGRLLAVVDTLDAITSDRPYRKGRSLEWAIDEIKANSGAQFNPAVAEACIAAHARGKLDFLFVK